MIAKVIAHGETREEAISKLHDALEELKVEGIKTNTPMLLQYWKMMCSKVVFIQRVL